MSETDFKRTSPPPSPFPAGRNNFWWIMLIFLLLWNLIGLFYHVPTERVVTLPYSEFIQQTTQDNVSEVHIIGSQIRGHFIESVTWPQHKQSDDSGKPGAVAEKSSDYKDFMTTFPQSVGDQQLLPLLEKHHVQITAETPSQPWVFTLLMNLLPFLLLIGYFWWMGQRAMKQQASIFGRAPHKVRRFDSSRPGVTFNDVAGADSAKQQLMEEVDFLRSPDKYHEIGARIPRGVLLAGPPGTGKTLLARAVAGEANVPFFNINGSEFVELFVGMGASRVRDVFRQARQEAPAILFIDEIDAVGRRRGASMGSSNDEREQTLNQLLVEMDGFDAQENVIVIAATNRADVLDPALLRPGRFDRQVTVGLPDSRGRQGILKIHTRALQLTSDVRLDDLAKISIGMSGAQLQSLCNEAALLAAAENRKQVAHHDFEKAMDKLLLGDVQPLLLDEATRRVIAVHESGHALVAWLSSQADTVHKVTIVPHGQALGVTEQRPDGEQYNVARRYLLARIAVLLGGRAAEEMVIGEITTGAENDLAEATRLARRMVMNWGMTSLGLVSLQPRGQSLFMDSHQDEAGFSEQTAAQIDAEIRLLLERQYDYVQQLLGQNQDKLQKLTERLLEQETVEHAELLQLWGDRPDNTQPPSQGEGYDHAAMQPGRLPG